MELIRAIIVGIVIFIVLETRRQNIELKKENTKLREMVVSDIRREIKRTNKEIGKLKEFNEGIAK